MAKWIDYPVDERRALVDNVAADKNIDQAAAEKDWWVTAVLYALFKSSIGPYALFKGGTSLSKGWNIISRFSEDVDIALDREYYRKEKKWSCADCSSNTQIHNLREKSQDFLFGEFKNELIEMLGKLGLGMVRVLNENEMRLEQGLSGTVDHDKDPSALFVIYPSLYGSDRSYATPVVKIEISCLSMAEPFEMKTISSLVQQVNSVKYGEDIDNDYQLTIKTVSPARTFLEKAFLLNEEFQKDHPRTGRMSRHLYDLEKLSKTAYGAQALSDGKLYKEIVNHREKFYHPGYVDYNKDLPDTIAFVPTGELAKSFKTDYVNMCGSFIYEKDPLSFEELLEKLKAIQELFRQVKV